MEVLMRDVNNPNKTRKNILISDYYLAEVRNPENLEKLKIITRSYVNESS